MRSLLMTLVIALSAPLAVANDGPLSNEKCLKVYRDAAIDLYDTSKKFNDGHLSRGEMVGAITAISAVTNAHRAGCMIFEDPSAQDCLPDYKEVYTAQRDRIHLRAILMGNQREVSLRLDLKPRIAYLDFVCGLKEDLGL